MEHSRKKLPGEKVKGMTQMKIENVKPYALIWAPAYLFFKANDKLVSIKRPLDFFTNDELNSIKPYEILYFDPYVQDIVPIQEKGKKLRAALDSERQSVKSSVNDPFGDVALPPANFELSDYSLRIAASLWLKSEGIGLSIEPFLIVVFVNEVCDSLSPEKLVKAREINVVRFSNAILKSSWVVFLALHLGYCHLAFLNRLFNRAFDDSMNEVILDECSNEIDELIKFGLETVTADNLKLIKDDVISNREERIAQKIDQRLERVSNELLKSGDEPPSIFGTKGFIDG